LDYDLVEESITQARAELDLFRKRNLLAYEQTDRDNIKAIYGNFLRSIRSKGKAGTKNDIPQPRIFWKSASSVMPFFLLLMGQKDCKILRLFVVVKYLEF
jgi:hypothetical protein